MSFIAFAWLSSFLYGFVLILTKLTSKYTIRNEWLFNFLYAGSVLLWTIPISLLNHAGLPSHWEYIIFTGSCYAVSGLLYIIAIYKLDVSTISPLYNFQTAFAVILAAFLLHESLAFWQYFLIAVIFFAGIFTSIDETFDLKSFFRWPVFIIIGATFFLGLGGIFANRALAENNYWTMTLWVSIISQIILLPTFFLFKKDISTLTIKPILALILVGACDLFGLLAAYKAYQVNVALSAVIISLPMSLLLVILLSVFYPKLLEKHSVKVYAIRITAAIIMFAAALKLSL